MFQKWFFCAALFTITPVHLLLENSEDTENTDGYIPCKEGWYLFGEKCYKLFGADRVGWDKRNWEDAKKTCENSGGHLATVQSKEVQDFLLVYLLLESDYDVWIGLNDKKSEAEYEWLDGTEFNYSNWNFNEPSEYIHPEEDCVHMNLLIWGGVPGKWNDRKCTDGIPYICQVDKGKQNKMSRNPTICPPGIGGGLKYGDSCYNIVKSSMTWYDAEKYCQDQHKGHLVTILNFQTEYFLKYIMRNFNRDIWLGIKMKDQIRQKFSSGWPVAHTIWLKTPPVFVDGTCVVLRKEKWEVVPCAEKYPFICEVSTVSPPVLRNHIKDSKCPELTKDWIDLGGEYCYFIDANNNYDWLRATVECNRRGSSLASFHSKEEQNALAPYTKNALFRNRGLWIGLFGTPDFENKFEWFDGSQVDFTYWNLGEPSENHESCIEILPPSMRWNDIPCGIKMGYICAVKKLPPNVMESETVCNCTRSPESETVCECTSYIIFKIATAVSVCILLLVIILSVVLNYFRPWKKGKNRRRPESIAPNVPAKRIYLPEIYKPHYDNYPGTVVENDDDNLYEVMG